MASRDLLHCLLAGLVFVSFAAVSCACTGQAACPSAPPQSAAVDRPAKPTLMGTFEGYTEGDDSLPPPLVLTIDGVDRDGQVRGTFRFGTKVDPLPDPPPGLDSRDVQAISGRGYEGFRHTLVGARLEGDRLRVGFSGREPFASWCARQKTFPQPPSAGWSCAPPSNHVSRGKCVVLDDHGAEQAFDCTTMHLCSEQVCECDRDRCGANMASMVTFDMVLEGDKLTGTVGGLGTGRIPVRFVRKAGG